MVEQRSLFGGRSTKINHAAMSVVYVSHIGFVYYSVCFVVIKEVKIDRINIRLC